MITILLRATHSSLDPTRRRARGRQLAVRAGVMEMTNVE